MLDIKLLRDNPEIVKKSQKNRGFKEEDVDYVIEYDKKWRKLKEEVEEFLESNNNDELADILEVIYAICDKKGINKEKLEELRIIKNKKRGGFKNKIILDETK